METKFFLEHIQQHITDYFPEFQNQPEVKFVSKDIRDSATLFRYLAGNKPIIVKRRETRSIDKNSSSRPRRFKTKVEDTFEAEYRALKAIENLINEQDNPHFGYIRVLDVLHEHCAFIMVECQASTLNSIFIKQNRILAPFNTVDLTPIFYHAGVWLKLFHNMNPQDLEAYTETRHTTREDYLNGVDEMIAYLLKHGESKSFLNKLSSKISEQANEYLPHDMQTGRTHADYAMRNILITPDKQLVIFDTLAKWRTAIYEDIGYFIARILINQLQVYSLGLAYDRVWIQKCIRTFLEGYFGDDTIPNEIINLYIVLAILDKWTSLRDYLERSHKPKHYVSNKVRDILSVTHFKNVVWSLLI